MPINVNGKWRITTDRLNYIPEKWCEEYVSEKGPHKGKVVEAQWRSVERYYGSLEQALVGILRYETNELTATEELDIKQAVERLNEIKQGLLSK